MSTTKRIERPCTTPSKSRGKKPEQGNAFLQITYCASSNILDDADYERQRAPGSRGAAPSRKEHRGTAGSDSAGSASLMMSHGQAETTQGGSQGGARPLVRA